ncbi:hypothetical protein CK203_094238 [Vitis vinifera]|uniref:Uncharacterized protein n=1 Tax=Vitis vinifera TaxID=29760 RepID=A0A438DD57_VITVI|nr:hypothetical protein CK203_094238 [Vitis vinifera]
MGQSFQDDGTGVGNNHNSPSQERIYELMIVGWHPVIYAKDKSPLHLSPYPSFSFQSSMRLAKKLLGAKKAWKSLTSRVQSKLHKHNISKAKKYATHLLTGLSSIRHLVASTASEGFCSHICGPSVCRGCPWETSKGKQVVAEDSNGGKAKTETGAGSLETKASEKSGCTVSDAWKAAVASSPQLRGVDERADEFISKFHKK